MDHWNTPSPLQGPDPERDRVRAGQENERVIVSEDLAPVTGQAQFQALCTHPFTLLSQRGFCQEAPDSEDTEASGD